jgi:hypothetical protein
LHTSAVRIPRLQEKICQDDFTENEPCPSFKLAEHSLQDDVVKVNEAAVNIARRVISGSFKPVLLAGSVGPLGARLAPLGRISVEQARAAFAEQIGALVHAQPQGVDLVILETMSDLKELETAVAAARSVAPDIPIITQMTFTRDDRTLLGHTPDAIARRLSQLDVDVIGVNCSGGPAQVLRLIAMIHELAPNYAAFGCAQRRLAGAVGRRARFVPGDACLFWRIRPRLCAGRAPAWSAAAVARPAPTSPPCATPWTTPRPLPALSLTCK